jgi:hypothetical protein
LLCLGLRGWEFCTICPFFANFSYFRNIPKVPSFQSQINSRENCFCRNAKNRPKIAKPTKHRTLPNRYANFLKFPSERDLRARPTAQKCTLPSRDFPVKTVLCRSPPSTKPYQNETQFPLRKRTRGNADHPKVNFAGNEV